MTTDLLLLIYFYDKFPTPSEGNYVMDMAFPFVHLVTGN